MSDNSIYKTETFEFDFLKREIRLYRKRFNYKTIAFKDVNFIEVKVGKVVRNLWLLTLLAVLLFLFAIALTVNLFGQISTGDFSILEHNDIRRIGVNIILLFSFIFSGLYLLYTIFRKEKILLINRNKKPHLIRELEKSGRLKHFLIAIKNSFKASKIEID